MKLIKDPYSEIGKKRRKLLLRLAGIMGNCDNKYIANWGPNGVQYTSGRSFNYPLSLPVEMMEEGNVYRNPLPVDDPLFMFQSFQFGANRMSALQNLEHVLQFLERECGLVIEEDPEPAS